MEINIDNDYRYYKEGTTISSINPYGFKDKDKISDMQKYFDDNNYIIRSDKFEVNGINEINSNGIINWEFTINNPNAVAYWDTYYKVFISELTNATCTIKANNTINIDEIKGEGTINTVNNYLFVLSGTNFVYEVIAIESEDCFRILATNYNSKVIINYYNSLNKVTPLNIKKQVEHKREWSDNHFNYFYIKFNPNKKIISIE